MRLDRRAFLGLGAAALGAWRLRECGAARVSALDIHRATRNTRLGAVGARAALPGRPAPFKPYVGAPRVALAERAGEPGRALEEVVRSPRPASAGARSRLDATTLARLLRLANGVTGRPAARPGPPPLRAAPSAGALYAGEVYVVAERIDGLAPGVYYYSVPEHALVELAPGSALARVAEALEPPPATEGAAAAVCLTNVFARYSWRYANRGYRYALIDSGHIGENLRLAAGADGLWHADHRRFCDDALNAVLGVDGGSEAVCAVHVVGGGPAAGPAAAQRRLVERQDAQGPLPARGNATERYHEATKLVPAGREIAPFELDPVPDLPRSSGAVVPLPRARDPGWSVARCIEARRSARRFRADLLSIEDLSFVLELAAGHPDRDRGALALLLAVHGVRGLAPGLYAYDPDGPGLACLRSGDLRGALRRACLGQRKAASASVAFVMVGALGAGARGEARRYRDLLLDAGALGERIYLAAEALGLAARNLAAFVDDALAALLGLEGRDTAPLHLTVLGAGD